MKTFKISARTFKEVFKVIPVYATIFYILGVIIALLTATQTFVMALVLENAYRLYTREIAIDGFIHYVTLYLILYAVTLIVNMLWNSVSSYGFYTKGKNIFRLKLGLRASELTLLDYENPEILNLVARAKSSVTGNKMANLVWNVSRMQNAVISIVGITVVLATFSVWLIPIAVISCIPTLVAKTIRGREFYNLQRLQIPRQRTLSYFWRLFLSPIHIKEMRTHGFDRHFAKRWENINADVTEETWNFQKKDASIMFFLDCFRVFCYAVGVIASLYLAYSGRISVGQFGACIVAFSSLQGNMFSYFRQLSGFVGNCQYVVDYFAVLDMKPEQWGEQRTENMFSGISDKIEIRNVSFKYPATNKPALENINLTVRKGEKIAVIGENGSGKTTLSKIIIGLYQPERGTVLYDGKELNQYYISSYYNRISVVSQYFTRYLLSLRENVGISDVARLSEDHGIKTSLNRADIAEVLDKTKTLDGTLGREFGGAELSGGQWQKLSISRGLFREYDFIVLDEPTSALDPLVETQIFTKFMEAMDNKTALIISHRIGFCRLADKILVMSNGQISEEGTHDELIKLNGEYKKMFDSQAEWYR